MPQSNHLRVLMTGGGAPGAAGILQCLLREPGFAVVMADAREQAVGRYLHPDFIAIPPAGDQHFIFSLVAACREKKIDILLPLVTRELLPLAYAQEEFLSAGTKVIVSPAASLEVANNKSSLYQFLQWRGIAVPDFRVVDTVAGFREAVAALGYPGRPVCFKPSVSNGSRGFRVIDKDIDEQAWLFEQKPGATHITYDEAVRILSLRAFPELLVSEYLPGAEYSVDCLADHGETRLVVPRLRQRMVNGISVEGKFVKDEAIFAYCRRIIHELKLHGNIGIQLKTATSGEILVLEINPRLQGTIAAGLGAGVNLPVLAVQQEAGIRVALTENDIRWGTGFTRYWQEVFYES